MNLKKSDEMSVDLFAQVMKVKLLRQQRKGYSGWDKPSECSLAHLKNLGCVKIIVPLDKITE